MKAKGEFNIECPKLINCVPKFSHGESKHKETSPKLSKSKVKTSLL